MTATLPVEVQQVFDRFITSEFTAIDRTGQPITWPLTPYYALGDPCIDVTTGIGYPKKADDARANPKVALLFSDATGSGLAEGRPPQVLVQGIADVDDRDLDANRERYAVEAAEKLPATAEVLPPKPLRRFFAWYFARIYVHVRPERVYVWQDGDVTREPLLLDAHMEEVRSGHDEEPPGAHAPPEGAPGVWDPRLDELGARYPTAVLTIVAPDGFPFSARVPIAVDRAARRVRLAAEPLGLPLQPGRACVTAHDHGERFTWQRNFQVRGDLVEEGGAWSLVPRRLIGGFELPPSRWAALRANAGKAMRYRRKAREELRRRSSQLRGERATAPCIGRHGVVSCTAETRTPAQRARPRGVRPAARPAGASQRWRAPRARGSRLDLFLGPRGIGRGEAGISRTAWHRTR